MHRKYSLGGGLTQEDLENVFSEVLDVLENVGTALNHPEIMDLLARTDGIQVKNGRVCYSRDMVKDFIRRAKSENAEYSYNRKDSDRFRMVGPYMGLYYVNPETGERHLATSRECIDAVKLCDCLDMYGPSPLHLQTVPVHLRQVATEKICIENSREIGGYCVAENIKEAEFMCRLGQAAGRKPPYCTIEIPISPLRLNHHALDILYRNRDHSRNLKGLCLGGGAVPMPGATAPIFFPGNLVQGMAEALAAYITPKLIDPDVYGYCSFGGFIFDLKKMAPSKPFPESILYYLAIRQVIKHVLGETFGVSFSFNTEDIQEVFRIAFAASLGICSGAATFLGVGSDGDGFNPVRAVIQADVIRHCARFAEGIPFNEEKCISSKTIREAIFEGMPDSFLDHPSTLNYRQIYLEPELFFKYSGDVLQEKAREIVMKKIAEHDYRLPKEKQDAVEEIFKQADATLKK